MRTDQLTDASIASRASNAHQAFDASQLAGLGIKPWVSFLAHRQLAYWVFALVLLASLPLVWIKGESHFFASATVQIAPRYMKTLKDDNELDFQSNSQYRQFVEHQARSVARYDIVERAFKIMGATAKQFQAPNDSLRRSIEKMQERIQVSPIGDTYLMQISIEGKTAQGLAEFLNALVEAYVARMKEEQMFGADERVKKLQAREQLLLVSIADKTSQRTNLALELGVSNFNQGDGNPYDKLLLATRATHAEARNARLAAQAKLKAYVTHGETDITIRSVTENILADPGLNSLKASLNNRRALLLTSISGLTPAHPAHMAARQELAEIEQEIAQQTQKLKSAVQQSVLSRYQMSMDQAQAYENEVGQVLQDQQKMSAKFAQKFNQALTLSSELAQHTKELETLRDRLSFFAAETGALGFVRKVSPALIPELPMGRGRKKLLLMAIMAAFAMGLLAPIVRDLAERTVRTVNDVESTLKLPSLGWLIEKNNLATNVFAQDQLRRIAGGFMREQMVHGTQVFALCAVKPGAGSSQLCLDLAKVLDTLGFPTLVVEANAFRPDLRYAGATAGLAQALSGSALPADCVLPADHSLPARVGVGVGIGVGANSGTHLSRLDQLPVLIAQWAKEYAFVIVDLPPLLLCADAEIIMNRLAQTILVVEAGGISRGELARAGRMLDKSCLGSLGVVVNRVRALDGGGYLKQLLIEFVTQRKYRQFNTQSDWHWLWQNLRLHLHSWLKQCSKVCNKVNRKATKMEGV